MTKNPFVNALAATTYITVIASMLYYGPQAIAPANSVIVPIILLSLFVLSAAMMGYFFLYQPLQFFFEGKQKASNQSSYCRTSIIKSMPPHMKSPSFVLNMKNTTIQTLNTHRYCSTIFFIASTKQGRSSGGGMLTRHYLREGDKSTLRVGNFM